MSTRDPSSRDAPSPTSLGADGVREPTQSLSLDPDEAHSALAMGTHRSGPTERERRRSPSGRVPRSSRGDDPTAYLDAVLGSYRVLELLGKGGMGYVYRAEHIKLGREVALKLLRNDYASRRDAVARFFQEARTVNRVRHRNIVDVTDFVELDDGTTYIVMELLSGTSLGAWALDSIDLPRALAVLIQICDGLGAAHDVGVIHRDLKPDNVIVVPTSDGAELVKLLDFGVAKLLNRDDEDVGFQTAAGSVIGTPAYMSPEQAGGMEIDARSDIYSLGAIMYELFSGQPMFRGRSFGEYVRKHLTENPVPLRQTPGGADLDPQLEAVILRCLEKDPEQRFPHIALLRDALLHLLGGMALRPSIPSLTSGVHARGDALPATPHIAPPPTASAMSSAAAMPPIPAAMPPTTGSKPQRMPPTTAMPRAMATSSAAAAVPSIPAAMPPTAASAPMFLDGSRFPLRMRPSRPATPWWVWFIGGGGAVGIGVVAAIWFFGHEGPDLLQRRSPRTQTETGSPASQAAPSQTAVAQTAPSQTAPSQPTPSQPTPSQPTPSQTAPTTPPIEPPARPSLIEIRVDSSPSGGVFADDRPVELCRTPCSFNVDPSDGGPLDRRTFVVKQAGYQDSSILVDLALPARKREFSITLRRAEAAAGRTEPRARDAEGKSPAERRPKRPARASRKDQEPRGARDTRDADEPTSEPEPATPAPAKKPPGPPVIDPADTLDPFRKP